MGQQQLLLLVLGIVVVSAAVVVGIDYFDENRKKARTDSEYLKMLDLASQAQAWKSKPTLMGGGKSSDPADFSAFSVEVLGLSPSGGPSTTPFVDIPGAGCFRFFPSVSELRINSLNEECVIGSWTKGIVITGTSADDISWSYRDQP